MIPRKENTLYGKKVVFEIGKRKVSPHELENT